MTRMLGTSREPTLRGRDDQIGELRSAVDSAMAGRLSVVVIENRLEKNRHRMLMKVRRNIADTQPTLHFAIIGMP